MVDPWSGPPPTPGQFPYHAAPGDGIRALLDKIKGIETNLREVTSNLLSTAGIRLTQLGMFIDSSLTVGGSLDVTGPMVVGGTLSLPAGIINNAALASPVVPQALWQDASNFGMTTTPTIKVTMTVTVPAGFTQALAFAAGRVYAINNTASADNLYSIVKVGAVGSPGFPTAVSANNGYATSVNAFSTLVTGLTGGGSVVISLYALSSTGTWAANALNAADLSVSLIWLR